MKIVTSNFLFYFFTATCSSCFANDAPLRTGDSLYESRKELISSGWVPIVTYEKMDDGTLRRSLGNAKKIYGDGIPEVETCSGAGIPFCSFNYKKEDLCLQVVTIGEYDEEEKKLAIHHWNLIDCQSLSVTE